MANNQNDPAVTDFKLKASYWYVTHKLQLRAALTMVLIFINIGLFGYVLWRGTYLFFIDTPRYLNLFRTIDQDLINYSYFRQDNRPEGLQFSGINALRSVDDNFDFVALVRNPNNDWVAKEVTVELISDGSVVASKNTFVYPGEEKYVVFFNQEGISQAGANIRLNNVQWSRQANFENFANQRLNFTISDIDFQPVSRANIPGQQPVSTLTFTIDNDTAYSYWNVGLYMVLGSGNGVAGINFLSLDQFRSGESRNVNVTWNQSLPSISQVRVLPEVDILNAGSYMPVE